MPKNDGRGELDDNAGGNCSKCEYCAIWASAVEKATREGRAVTVEKAVREEREAVVRHLRAHADGYVHGDQSREHFVLHEKAAQIARGDHRK